jgi:mRNA-degrading endonuclease toxin of MazEF toxin-antitoxin module
LLVRDPAPGSIVVVDWRDDHIAPEPGKRRPAVVISNPAALAGLRVLTVVPLTGQARLALPALSIRLEPSPKNGLIKPCFALAWNIQTIAFERISEITAATITSDEVSALKRLLFEYLNLD